MRRIGFFVFSASILHAEMALAHTRHGFVSSLTAGFSHRFGGLDHLLAMFAVGLLVRNWVARS